MRGRGSRLDGQVPVLSVPKQEGSFLRVIILPGVESRTESDDPTLHRAPVGGCFRTFTAASELSSGVEALMYAFCLVDPHRILYPPWLASRFVEQHASVRGAAKTGCPVIAVTIHKSSPARRTAAYEAEPGREVTRVLDFSCRVTNCGFRLV
jgi:hypothetical protein